MHLIQHSKSVSTKSYDTSSVMCATKKKPHESDMNVFVCVQFAEM